MIKIGITARALSQSFKMSVAQVAEFRTASIIAGADAAPETPTAGTSSRSLLRHEWIGPEATPYHWCRGGDSCGEDDLNLKLPRRFFACIDELDLPSGFLARVRPAGSRFLLTRLSST